MGCCAVAPSASVGIIMADPAAENGVLSRRASKYTCFAG